MMSIINRNSYIVLTIIMWLALAAFMVSDGVQGIDYLTLTLAAVFFYGLHRLTLKQNKPTIARTPAEAAAGKPTLIEYYSDY